ncbi:MAG: lactonase family protein [Candidatus Poribacteria bacterium]|nr:lactonase family protein [Candidatus Poribacteria bacterium]
MPSIPSSFYAYVSIAGENKISIFKINPETGALTPQGDTAVSDAPSVLAMHPTRPVFYTAIRSNGDILSFQIDPETGQLSLINTTNTGLEDPAYLEIDKTGDFLLTPYYIAGKVTVYRLREDGAPQSEPCETRTTAAHAHGVTLDSSNRFAFVSHTCPGNAIFQFHFDDRSGTLTPNAVPKIVPAGDDGPRHIRFHPSKDVVYADNEQGSSVTAYTFDASSGTLSPFQTLPTLPAGYDGQNSCARLEMHPSGKFLYAANRGHDSIAGFAIGPDGALTSTGYYPTEKTPRSFSVAPNGNFLLSAGQSANKLISYRIDTNTGALHPLTTYDVGNQPWWVLVAKIPG